MNLYLIFDGGNGASVDKVAYGSFRIYNSKHGEMLASAYVEFGTGYTNNEAEYMTIIAALEYIIDHQSIEDKVSHIDLDIEGDSELIRCQIGTYSKVEIGTLFGEVKTCLYHWSGWKVKAAHLEPLRDKARGLLEHFNRFTYTHISRKQVVAILGH